MPSMMNVPRDRLESVFLVLLRAREILLTLTKPSTIAEREERLLGFKELQHDPEHCELCALNALRDYAKRLGLSIFNGETDVNNSVGKQIQTLTKRWRESS